jgi:serine/threonine protein kinase
VIVDHPQLLAERYRIDEALGTGGMSTVFAGHDLRLDRAAAVKVLRDDLARDPSFRRRFAREARAAARVVHPNVVAVYDTGEDAGGETFIVMELLSGRTFVRELARGPLDEARLRAVADAVLGALAAAHAEGIVHRDVKPANLLLDDDDRVKVADFGIATSLDAGETTTVVPLGTPAYCAPERLRGFPATERSDLYSLGVVLYEAATGERPFRGDGAVAIAEAVVTGAHRPLGECRPDLSQSFVATVERALATDPDARFTTADEMRAALRAEPPSRSVDPTVPLQSPAPATATLPVPAPTRPRPGARPPSVHRRRPSGMWRAVAAALVVAVLVLAVVLLVTRGGNDEPSSTAPSSVAPSTVPAPAGQGTAPPVPASLERALQHLERAAQP